MEPNEEDFDDVEVPPEVLAEFISTFMSSAALAEGLYRKAFCDVVAGRIYDEFGAEGLCELMVALDKKGEWISDILFESPDLEDIAFTKYGIYDAQIAKKARYTKAMAEMNTKLWRLRKKYAKLIVDEIVSDGAQESAK
jgi:hypothetical protein